MDNPFDNQAGLIWLNGEFSAWDKAKVHVMDYGLHYASAVFEGERAYNGNIFALNAHSQRLIDSSDMIRLDLPYDVNAINDICLEVMAANKLTNCYLRPIAWRTTKQLGISIAGSETNLAVAAWQWPDYFGSETRGIALATSRWRRPSPECAPVHAKASSLYVICTLAREEVVNAGYDDALMLDWRGQIAESTGANIFFVKDGELHTPVPDCFLNGITRQTVISIAGKNGVKVHERAIMPAELPQFSECFVCGTAAEVMAVRFIDDHKFQVGKITKRLAQDYADFARG